MNRIARAVAVAVALGLTTICLAWLVEPLIKSTHDAIFHWSGSPAVLFGPVALDVALVWAALTLLLVSAQGAGRWRVAVWAGVLLVLPWIVLRNVQLLWPASVPQWLHLPPFYVAAIVWVLVVVLWRRSVSRQSEPVIEFASTVLAFVAISGALFLTQLTLYWWSARSLNRPLPLHQEQAKAGNDPSPGPRIIWIVLDELSYQQVYERRYPGLELPTFDALAGEATVFTHAVAAGKYTEYVLPSLLSGEGFDKVRSSASGWMSTRDAATEKWKPFDEHNTVFQDALNDGYRTTAAGWYNPYCRIYAEVLDRCYWTNDAIPQNGMTADGSFGSNWRATVGAMVGSSGTVQRLLQRMGERSDEGDPVAEAQIVDYRSLSAAGDRALLDRSAGFTFLHLPIPHPVGIYNRATGQLTSGPSTYIDNLALADKYVAHVRSLLEASGQWDSSTVIVMGDHGWRTFIWRIAPGWTEEEERASDGGRFDDRPAYIVKLAGEQKGARIDLPFRAVETRALMDALMAGKIRTAEELQSWVRQSLQHP